MAGFFRGIAQVVAVFALATDVIWVYFAGGWGWTIASVVFLPITAIATPFLALAIEPREIMPLVLAVVFLVLLGISGIAEEAKDKSHKARPVLDRVDRRTQTQQSALLMNTYPVLQEMLMLLDTSYTVNGEIEMDYTRFTSLLYEARNDLGRLGIQLPNVNEGGDGAIFHQTLRRVAECARVGDISGARRSRFQ